MKRAVKQDSGVWEVTAEMGREKQLCTAQHRGLIIADQMNARSGEMLLFALAVSRNSTGCIGVPDCLLRLSGISYNRVQRCKAGHLKVLFWL